MKTGYEIYTVAQLEKWRKEAVRFGDGSFAGICHQAITNKERDMMDEERGFYLKYQVRHADGSELSPGMVFVLRPDRDPAAWDALKVYAFSTKNQALAGDLLEWLEQNPCPEMHEKEIIKDDRKAMSKDEFWEKTDEVSLARGLRLATIQSLFDGDHLSEDEAREVLAGPLSPGDESTVYDDSACLEIHE